MSGGYWVRFLKTIFFYMKENEDNSQVFRLVVEMGFCSCHCLKRFKCLEVGKLEKKPHAAILYIVCLSRIDSLYVDKYIELGYTETMTRT